MNKGHIRLPLFKELLGTETGIAMTDGEKGQSRIHLVAKVV
jgi:hypothetical protein